MNRKLYTFIILPLVIFLMSVQMASAGDTDKLKGYAWSDNIGWISFNCSNTDTCHVTEYGVTIDQSGNVTGFAWSDNVGWLDFSYFSNATLDSSTGIFSGDAQFLAALEEGVEWDGKVSLSGASPTYGITLDSTAFEVVGYAWGDEVVGWISFNCLDTDTCNDVDYSVTYDPFLFVFTSNEGTENNKVTYDGSVILSWTTDDVFSCTAANGTPAWTDENPQPVGEPSSASQTINNLTADTIFSLECADSASNTITRTLNILVNPPPPLVVIGADNTNIAYNKSTNLNWTATNVSDCTASTGLGWSGAKAIGGPNSEQTVNLTAATNVFEIYCTSLYLESYPDPVVDNVQVNVEKLELYFYPESNPVPYNDTVKLFYGTEFAAECSATGSLPGWSEEGVDLTPGEHSFVASEEMGEIEYTATLSCSGSSTQSETKTINLWVRKNPEYDEI